MLLLSGNIQKSEEPRAAATGPRDCKGLAVVTAMKPQDWISMARVLVDGEEHVALLKTDGSFVVYDIPFGS